MDYQVAEFLDRRRELGEMRDRWSVGMASGDGGRMTGGEHGWRRAVALNPNAPPRPG
jgi:hypothetical protein